MAETERLYRRPMITATVLLLIGLGSLLSGFYYADLLNESNYYALAVLGFVLIISAAVTFLVYGSLERKFRSAISGKALLDYSVPEIVYGVISGTSSEDIRKGNRALLYIMLAFCAILAVLGPLIADDGILMTFIALGIALFLTVSEFLITRYRVGRLRTGSRRVVLSECGAFVCGEFHTWCGISLKLLDVEQITDIAPVDGFSLIRIRYQALTLPGPSVYSVVVPVPSDQTENVIASLTE